MRVDGCAFAARREAFERAGGFAEHFSPYGAEDAHFAYKVLDAGYRILYYPRAVAVHAFSPAGRTGIQFIMHVRNMLLIPLARVRRLAPAPGPRLPPRPARIRGCVRPHGAHPNFAEALAAPARHGAHRQGPQLQELTGGGAPGTLNIQRPTSNIEVPT
jgi:hypothetical protein